MPPVRVVEDGELRRDLEEEYMRRSRMPELVAVDLRAQIAGCRGPSSAWSRCSAATGRRR